MSRTGARRPVFGVVRIGLAGLAIAAGAPPQAGADPCPPLARPYPFDARDDGSFSFATPPFVALTATVAVQGCGPACLIQDLHAERCGPLRDDPAEIPSTHVQGPLGSQASVDLRFEDGLYVADLHALVPSNAATDEGMTGAIAVADFGFRDVLDVASSGSGAVQLTLDFELDGLWSNWKCFQGIASRPPVHEVQLWVFDTAALQNVVDYDVFAGTEFAAAIDETFTFAVEPPTTLQAHLFVSLQAPASTFVQVGDQFCEGGESIADFSTIRLRFHNPDPAVTVVPQSGIRYSATVPEPDAGGAAALAALFLLRRTRRRRELPYTKR